MTKAAPKKILVVDPDATEARVLLGHLKKLGCVAEAVATRDEARRYLDGGRADAVILSLGGVGQDDEEFIARLIAACPVVVLASKGSIESAVRAVRAGACDFLVRPISPARLEAALATATETLSVRRATALLERKKTASGPRMVGASAAFRHTLEMIEMVAPADTTVSIEGETGVGKELVAAAIHAASARRNAHFVAIDCCTLQENLLESELFGHERGAFTGADRQKEGLIEVAEGGTVFLDEIGEIGPAIQAKLLRVLETGRFRRLGGTKDLAANVRFVTATNRPLSEMVKARSFRSDLYYRLSAFSIPVPPLRERREDILPIAEHFLEGRSFLRRIDKRFGASCRAALVAYPWPGNIRELRNTVERAILMSGEREEIVPADLGLVAKPEDRPASFSIGFDHLPTFEEVKAAYIARVAEIEHGSRRDMARVTGISERNIYRLIGKMPQSAE